MKEEICRQHETAEPLAIMDGSRVTALRTGVAAAIGAKYLARPGSKKVGIIGTGTVGRASLATLNECFPLERVYATDISVETQGDFIRAGAPAVAGECLGGQAGRGRGQVRSPHGEGPPTDGAGT